MFSCSQFQFCEGDYQVFLAQFAVEQYFSPNISPTVAEVIDHWLENKRRSLKSQSIKGYLPLLKNIVGPLLQGTPQERVHYALTGEKPQRDSKLLLMLGDYKVSELTTAQLRRWHSLIRIEAGERGIPVSATLRTMLLE